MADIWYYTRGGKQMEPVSTGELRQLASQGLLKPTDLVWKQGMAQWVKAASAGGIFEDSHLNGPVPQRHAGDAPPRRGTPREVEPISSPSGRYQSRKGMSTGAKVSLVLGVVLLLGGLAVAAVLLKINASKENPTPSPSPSPSTEPVPKEVEILRYTASIGGKLEDNRNVELKAGAKYEISVVNEAGGMVTVYLDDELLREVGKHEKAFGTAKITYTPGVAGRHRIQVINEMDREAKFAVAVKEIGGGEVPKVVEGFPKVIEKYSVMLFDTKDDTRRINLKNGVRYEMNVASDRKNEFSLYLDDAGGLEVASMPKCFGTAKLNYTASRDGEYRLVIINNGPGASDFRVEVVALGVGGGGVIDLPKGPDIVTAYKVNIRNGGDDKRTVDLKAATRYEITATSVRGNRLDIYLDDFDGREVGKVIDALGTGKMSYTPAMGGRFRLEVVNQGVGDSDFTVVVRDMGPGAIVPPVVKDHAIPGLVEKYREFIRERADHKRFVDLKAGIRYEITAKSDINCKTDLFLDDPGLKQVASQVGAPGFAKVTYVPTIGGNHRIEVFNGGFGDSNYDVEVRSLGKDAVKVIGGGKDHSKPGLIDSYRVFIVDLREDMRHADLQAGIRYEITARSDKGCRMDLFIDDAGGKEIARDINTPGPAKAVFTPTVGGRYRIELVNKGIGDSDFTVELRSLGRPVKTDHTKPGVVESYKVFIADLKENQRTVDLSAGIRYEITAKSDKFCRLDMYLDDAGGKEVAKAIGAAGTGKIVVTPAVSGGYRIEIINNGIGDSNFDVEVRSFGVDKGVKIDPVKPGIVTSYKVFIKDLKEDRRMVDLKAGVRYEISARSDKGCRLDIYLDDEGGKELAKHVDAAGAGKLSYTATFSGKHRVEVVNMGVGDSNFDVEVRAFGAETPIGPAKLVDSYKAFIKDLGDNKHPVNLDAGTKYEITAVSAIGCRMDIYVDDDKGKEMARVVGASAKGALSFTPPVAGRYHVVVVNGGLGDSNFTVEIRSAGGAGGVKLDGKFPVTIDSYDVMIKDLAANIKMFDFETDVRYEFTVTNDRGVNMNLFIVDELGIDVATDTKPDANCFINWLCKKTGKYKVEVSNQGIGDATAKVMIKAVGRAEGGPKVDPPKDKLPPATPVKASKDGTRVEGAITNKDGRDPFRGGSFCKVFEVNMMAGKTYTIDMTAGYDTYLHLADATGKLLLSDDDGGGGLNSRITFNPTAAGVYRIVCSTFGADVTGNFTLIVREN